MVLDHVFLRLYRYMLIDGTIVLEGGANRGVFTAGVLDYLMEKNIYFKNIIGVSAGAANALNYASHQKGRSKKTIVIDKKENKYINKLNIYNSKILDMEKIFETFPNITFPFDYEAYIKNKHNVEIATTNCFTGCCEFHKINPYKKDLKCCAASCSMPFAAPIVDFNNSKYVDGSVSNSIPLDYAQSLNTKNIVFVLTQKEGYYKKELSSLNKAMIRIKYKKYPKLVEAMLARPARYNNRIEAISKKEAKKELFVIRPEVDTISHLEQNVNVLNNFYDHGRYVISNKFNNFLEYLT